jgi:hypothetical protein
MDEYDHIVFHELSMIEKIIRDETWLEGERRGCPVPPSDIVVRANVCIAVLRIGEQFRATALKQIAKTGGSRVPLRPISVHHAAA